MPTKEKLGSERVKKSIEHLIREARKCIETRVDINSNQEKGVLGFAAMLTIFPIIISISEAIRGKRNDIDKLINVFATEMKNDKSWLITSSSRQNIKHTTLVDIRNGLVHAMSLPPYVLLTRNIIEAQAYWDENPGKYDCIIGIKEFIDEVEQTAYRLINEPSNSVKDFDPEGTKDFGPIDTYPPLNGYEDFSSSSGRGS